MGKRVILATAGSGKTYHLCHEIDDKKRNIIIAYTHQNIKNILGELLKRFGKIPDNTLVMTFHSFVYRFMIRPFDNMIGEFYGIENFRSKGVTIVSPPDSYISINNKFKRINPRYKPITDLYHYVENDCYYSDYLSKLIIKTTTNDFSLMDEGCKNINKFFDYIYIDEVQDFRENNWKLLLEIIKNVNNILLVGDYYQHSVSAVNNTGVPFKVGKKFVSYEDYIEYLGSLGLNVDTSTLNTSRRCCKAVCDLVISKLGINILSSEINNGVVELVTQSDKILEILNDNDIVKLVWERVDLYKFNAITWSYSKGDTYKNICIILTNVYSDLMNEDYKNLDSSISKNKLYVALTRSSGNVYIIKKEDLVL